MEQLQPPFDISATGDMAEQVWGCLECGTLSEAPNADMRCPACGDGLITEFGKGQKQQESQALFAYARKDATDLIISRGIWVGMLVGVLVALLVATIGWVQGPAVIAFVCYTAVLGALTGNVVALRTHRLLKPNSKLQPIRNPRRERRLQIATAAWAVVPAAVFAVIASSGLSLRTVLGRVFAWLGG